MASQYISEIRAFGCNFAPRGWARCEGQLISIAQNSALYSLLGNMYGGDGRTTFGLPDLRGRVPLGYGQGPGLMNHRQGNQGRGGYETVTLRYKEIPSHSHSIPALDLDLATMKIDGSVTVQVSDNAGNKNRASDNALGKTVSDTSGVNVNAYDSSPAYSGKSLGGVTHSLSIAEATTGTPPKTKVGNTGNAGGNSSHDNMQPYLPINFCIALIGLYPSRS